VNATVEIPVPPECTAARWPDRDHSGWDSSALFQACGESLSFRLDSPTQVDSSVRFGVFLAGPELRVVIMDPSEGASAEAEVHFDPVRDGLTRWQFLVNAAGDLQEFHYQPDWQVHRSSYRIACAARGGRRSTSQGTLFWFCLGAGEVFAHSATVGFQVGWSCGEDYVSWAFCSGNGGTDASSYGLLNLSGRKADVERSTRPRVLRHPTRPAGAFLLSVTNDPPMSLTRGEHTPDRLLREARQLRDLGVGRLHWIDYEPLLRRWPDPRWAKHVESSYRACGGNLLRAACDAGHEVGLQVIADLKIYDMGANMFWVPDGQWGSVEEIDGHSVAIGKGIDPAACMSLPEGFPTQPSGSIRKIRIFSPEPYEGLEGGHFEILVSADNRSYTSLGAAPEVRTAQIPRPHARWTPLGMVPEQGEEWHWELTFDHLEVTSPYLLIRWNGPNRLTVRQRGFLLVEATDAAGRVSPVTLATDGPRDFCGDGFFFWKERCRWFNSTDPLFEEREWNVGYLAMTFQHAPRMVALPEVCCEAAQGVWMGWIDRILDAGADGVNLRTLCHHNGIESVLKYSCGPHALNLFRERHGREFRGEPDDYVLLRRLRGDAFTSFIGAASRRVRERGKIFSIQFESGCEVPPSYETRMQFEFQWERMIRDRMVDEISVRWLTIYHPWVQQKVLPLATSCGIPIHAISRNLHGAGARNLPRTLPQWASDARGLGYAGCNLYELRDLMEPAGSELSACVVDAFQRTLR